MDTARAEHYLDFTKEFKTAIEGPKSKEAAELNNDGVINIVDLVLVAGSFGQSC